METKEPYNAGAPAEETYNLGELTRLELISLNRGLNCWLAELRGQRGKASEGSELAQTLDQAEAIAAGVCHRVDTKLGTIRSDAQQAGG